MDDLRSPRERLLGMATAARHALNAEQKRFSVLGLMKERLRMGPSEDGQAVCSEPELFEAAYGDAGGRLYWKAWDYALGRDQPVADVNQFARLLAYHVAPSVSQASSVEKRILAALVDVTGSFIDLVARLSDDPNALDCVPGSLSAYGGRTETHFKPTGRAADKKKRGKPADKKPRLLKQMAALDPVRLAKMKGEEMAAEFKASRTYCEEVRRTVLAERGNSDN